MAIPLIPCEIPSLATPTCLSLGAGDAARDHQEGRFSGWRRRRAFGGNAPPFDLADDEGEEMTLRIRPVDKTSAERARRGGLPRLRIMRGRVGMKVHGDVRPSLPPRAFSPLPPLDTGKETHLSLSRSQSVNALLLRLASTEVSSQDLLSLLRPCGRRRYSKT